MLLKCADTAVANLDSGEIFNASLLPVPSWGWSDILGFLDRRIYADTNKIARRIATRGVERKAFKLSLSDSYWVTADNSDKFIFSSSTDHCGIFHNTTPRY